jgi:predicted transcriptional regulator
MRVRSFRAPEELLRELQAVAQRDGVSSTKLIRDGVRRELDRRTKEYA